MNELSFETEFKKILNRLEIKKNDKILVNSNILKIISKFKNKNLPKIIIKCLKNKISSKGTLLFPTFNWNFCKGKTYDYKKTKSNTGALSNISLTMKDFKRSINPIYSFNVCGKDKKKITQMKHESCFGFDSPFGYLIKNKGKNLFIDLDYKDALTFVHVAEEKVGVNYRYIKKFEGHYVDENKKKLIKSCEMYVRKTDLVSKTIINKKFDKILKKKNALKEMSFKKIKFSVVDINTAYFLMKNDIKNQSGLIQGKRL